MSDPHNANVEPLPEDRAELDRMLLPFKMVVNPLMVGTSECLKLVGSQPLSKEEIDGGTHAFSALCAQYFPGRFMDSRFLVLMWCLGTLMPRLLLWIQEQKKKERNKVSTTMEMEAVREAKLAAQASQVFAAAPA